MRASVVLLSCLVLLQAIPVEKKFLQLGMDGDVELTSDNLNVVDKDDHEVQLLASEDSDLMINQLEPAEQSSMDDETPLNSAYFEDDGSSEQIEDASQNIVEDLQLIGQSDTNNNIVDENHQVMEIQQENLVEDNQNVNDEIQQELSSEQDTVQETQENAEDYLVDQDDNQVVDTLQVIDDEQQQQLISESTDVQEQEDNTIVIENDEQQEQTEDVQVDPNDPGMMNEENEQQSNCIQLYSQCYYKGESMKACNDLGLMKDFPYEIKSLKIPYGTTLTIYDHPNYEGERHTFSQSEECLNNVVVLTQIAF